MPIVYFYAPDEARQKSIQQDHSQWSGFHTNFTPWIAQTYFHLKQAGVACEITTRIPDKGILISDREVFGEYRFLRDLLDTDYPFLDKVMLICVKSDKRYYPSAHLHVVHNSNSREETGMSIWNPYRINHWPMPGIIPRDTGRRTSIVNISYIGAESQLAPELKSAAWKESLANLDLHWQPVFDQYRWNDYSDLDVIVAARSFDSEKYPNKGSVKLINAWHAGIPAILTPESGFMAERKTDLDFLIIRSFGEALDKVRFLKCNPELYQRIVDNGLRRAQEYTIEKTLNQWLDFLNSVAIPTYEQWSGMTRSEKKRLFIKRIVYYKFARITEVINRLVS